MPRKRWSSIGIPLLFLMIGGALLLFTAQIIQGLLPTTPTRRIQSQPNQAAQQVGASVQTVLTPVTSPTPQATPYSPFFTPSNPAAATLQLPTGHYVFYQNTSNIWLVSTTDQSVRTISTPGYTYSEAVRPLLTPNNQLLYSGSQGIWLT